MSLPVHVDAAVGDLSISDVEYVSSARAGRGVYEYTYSATLNNVGEAINNVTATVTSLSGATQIVDATVVFGDISHGITQIADTFSFRQNRRYRFNPQNLVWSFTADEPNNNTAPTADAGPDQQLTVGSIVSLSGLGSSDPEGDTLTYAWTFTPPPGSSSALSSNNVAAPTFTADVVGTFGASLIVSDGELTSVADDVSVTAIFSGDNPPSISSTAGLSGSVGEAYTYDVNATDPDLGDVLTYSLQLAPPGMSIDAGSGLISWLPAETGPVDVDVIVTDSTGLTDRQIFLLFINSGDGDLPPTLAPIDNQITVINQTVQAFASGTDPEGETLRYGLVNPPAGLSIHSGTGEILWTPSSTQEGDFPVIASVMDPGGQTDTESFTVTVLAETVNNPPVLDFIADQAINAQATLSLDFDATDADNGDILTFAISSAPPALQFDANSGLLSWTPSSDDAGELTLTASVTDSAGAIDTQDFTITVAEPPLPPVAQDDAYTIDRNLLLQIPAEGVLANDSDPNGDVLTASTTSLPTIGSLDLFPGNGAFDYTPPPNPPITIGLQEECRSPLNTSAAFSNPIVGDVDNDGEPELVGVGLAGTSLFFQRIWTMNGQDCSLETDVTLATRIVGSFSNRTPPALVNLDADPELELVIVRAGFPQGGVAAASLIALNLDGSFVWNLPAGASEDVSLAIGNVGFSYYGAQGPTVTDLDGDGTPEILMNVHYGNAGPGLGFMAIIAYNSDGTIRWEYSGPAQGGDEDAKPLYVADLDLDGTVEIIHHTSVISHEGVLEFILPSELSQLGNTAAPHLTVAIANVDTDPFPELLGRDSKNMYVFEHTGTLTSTIPRPTNSTAEITVGEFDGDPFPEYVQLEGAGSGNNASWLTAFDTDGTVLWSHQGTQYDGSGNGQQLDRGPTATAFDFDRDGIDEIVIVMNAIDGGRGLFVFAGDDGRLIDFFDGLGGDAPVQGQTVTIADVDGDNQAEVIYTDYTASLNNPYVVLGGLDGNPLAAARPVRHQRMYVATQVDPAGNTLPYPAPHWLIPGLNKWIAAPVLPFEDPGATDTFNYIANDGNADSNEATVTIAITNVNAPTIISRPVLGGSPGFDYQYGLLATDGDVGDMFTWSLVDAPAGMSVNSLGLINWLPEDSDLGNHRVQVIVTDLQGNTDEQTYTINVVPPTSVPDLLGATETAAADALDNAGLAVGSVTQAFSFNVPEGEVISQSITAGNDSAAGAFIDYVISLGPQPVFMIDLTNLTQPVAQAALAELTLGIGNVTFVNDDQAPQGTIVSQSVSLNTEVPVNTLIDVEISGGPALDIDMASNFVGVEESLAFNLSFYSNTGVALTEPGDLIVSIQADSDATGTLPTIASGNITTAEDTRGGYNLRIQAPSLGVDRLEPFLVSPVFAVEGAQEAYTNLAAQMNRLIDLYNDLGNAIRTSNFPAIQSLGAALQAERALIDLEALQFTPAAVPEIGFLPDGIVGPPSSGDAVFPQVLADMRVPLVNATSFLETLNTALVRNDDTRNRFLNLAIAEQVANFDAVGLPLNSSVVNAPELYDLLSLVIPRLMVADMDVAINALTAQGLVVQQGTPNAFYEQIAALENTLVEPTPAFFSLGGLMSASSIRTQLIKDMYVPILKKIAFRMQNLVAEALLEITFDVQQLPGIATGASLSFHSFSLGHGFIESRTAAPPAGANIVLMIGPTLVEDVAGAVSGLSVSFKSVEELKASVEAIKKAAEDAQSAIVKNYRLINPDETANGCVFFSGNCRQLGFSNGIPTVYQSGSFPAPVLFIQYNAANGKTSIGNFLFYPKAE